MTRPPGTRLARNAYRWLLLRLRDGQESGFILLESIIAITVITVIMGAVGAEFVNGMISTSQERTEQVAVQLADSAVEQIRSLHPSDLLTGRDKASVNAQFSAAPTAVKSWLTSVVADEAYDPNAAASAGATAAVPTTGTVQTPGNVAYTINEYLAYCSILATGSTGCIGTSTLASGVVATPYLRATVAVTWAGGHCGSSGCTYVTSTLVSPVGDPIFRINSAPYAAPVIVAPGAQTNAVGDAVSLQLTVQNGTGVPTFTWLVSSGSLPSGLGLSPTGLISGTVSGSAGTYSTTVQVTDAFQRTDTQVISWTVKPALLLTDPGPQATTTAQTVSLTLAATGGSGAPYTFADPSSTLPPGLTLTSAGVISGTPTVTGNYAVQIKVGDSSGTRFTKGTFTWTVTAPPLAASNPGTQTSTLATAITPITLSASGGSGSYTWTDSSPKSLPAGISVSTAGVISGTPTAVGTSSVTLTVADGSGSKAVSFSWVVRAKPTVTSPGDQASSVGASINLQLTTTCANSPCTYAFGTAAPSGLAISSTGLISGTVGATVKTFAGVTVVATDAAGATATSTAFNWVVNSAPTMASPGNQTTLRGGTVSLDVSGLDSGGTGATTFGASGLPSWLTINSATGKITGTAPASANSTTSGIRVSVTDASGVTATSATFIWNVTNLANSISDQVTPDTTSVSLDLNNYTTGGTSGYTYTASGLPSWLTLASSTGVISGTAPNLTNASTKTSGITVTVTDSKGAVVTTSAVNWYVTDIRWSAPATVSTAQGSSVAGYSAASYEAGGASSKVFSATGLPTGLSMATSGTISGTPNTKGTYNVTLKVVDSVGAAVSTTLTWTVT